MDKEFIKALLSQRNSDGLTEVLSKAIELMNESPIVKIDLPQEGYIKSEELIPIYERRAARQRSDSDWPIGTGRSLSRFKEMPRDLKCICCYLENSFIFYIWLDKNNEVIGCIVGKNKSST